MPIDITISRNKCVFSNIEDLEIIHTINSFPVYMGVTNQPIENDILEDLNFGISKSSGMVQINPIVNPKIIYEFSHNPGTIGKTWAKHHTEFADYIKKYKTKKVLEIGGHSGILANKCLDFFNYDWTIVDPNVENVDDRIKTYRTFFDENFETNENYDLIVHSHLIEHITDIDSFFKKCSMLLNNDGLMIFSFPNFDQHMKNNYLNSINFEHTIQLNEYFMDCFLIRNKFEIIEKIYMEEFTSIFYCVKKTNSNHYKFENQLINQLIKFKNYFKTIDNFVKLINKKYKEKNIYLFGAHVSSQFLLKSGLDEKIIKNALDNDTSKHNKRLYGTQLIVKSPNIIKEDDEPIIIVKVSFFDDEIKNQLIEINPKAKIITF